MEGSASGPRSRKLSWLNQSATRMVPRWKDIATRRGRDLAPYPPLTVPLLLSYFLCASTPYLLLYISPHPLDPPYH